MTVPAGILCATVPAVYRLVTGLPWPGQTQGAPSQRCTLRGYPETNQQRHAYIKQHSCGNERQDDRMGQAYEA